MDEEPKELVKSIENRCAIFLIICDMPHARKLLPTLLEDLYVDSQSIMLDYCVEGDGSG